MRFYNRQHPYSCGIDLHVKTMSVCILDGAGQVLVHRTVPSTPAAFLEIVGPYREDLVVAAECSSPGTGWPISVRPKASRSCSATRWP
jgi:predicted NBD/HSP70 family sugar kinase